MTVFAYLNSYSQASFRTLHAKPAIFLLVRKTRPPHRELRALLFWKKCVDSLAFHSFTVLIQEDLKVQPSVPTNRTIRTIRDSLLRPVSIRVLHVIVPLCRLFL